MKFVENNIWCRPTADGKARYQFRARFFDKTTGKQRDVRKALGPNLERARVEARRLEEEVEGLRRGDRPRTVMTLGDLVTQYVAGLQERGLLGWQTPAGHLKQFVEITGAHRPVRSLDRADIERFVGHRASEVRATTANNALRVVKTLLGYAEVRGLVDINVARRYRPLPAKKLPVTLPTAEELSRLLVSLRARRSWLFGLVVVLVGIGCRLGEALRLSWSDVDLARNVLILRRRKVDDALTFTLAGTLRDVLWASWTAAGMPREGLVFPSRRGKTRTRHAVRKALMNAAAKVGLPFIRPRTFRRMAAQAVAEREGMLSAAAMLGHASPVMTTNYLSASRQDESRRKAQGVTDRLLAEVTGTATPTPGAEVGEPTAAPSGVSRNSRPGGES